MNGAGRASFPVLEAVINPRPFFLRWAESPQRTKALRWHIVAAVLLAAVLAAGSTDEVRTILADAELNDSGAAAALLAVTLGTFSGLFYMLSILVGGLVLAGMMWVVGCPVALRTALAAWLFVSIPTAVRCYAAVALTGVTGLENARERLQPLPFVDPVMILTTFLLFFAVSAGFGAPTRKAAVVALTMHVVNSLSLTAL